ncbi:MAG: hypothetical protein M1826_003256 [Phylliscum demangeonii]|nr:MAG: hypothetical protein M1826_003256 [Phylliscum demangeonii]
MHIPTLSVAVLLLSGAEISFGHPMQQRRSPPSTTGTSATTAVAAPGWSPHPKAGIRLARRSDGDDESALNTLSNAELAEIFKEMHAGKHKLIRAPSAPRRSRGPEDEWYDMKTGDRLKHLIREGRRSQKLSNIPVTPIPRRTQATSEEGGAHSPSSSPFSFMHPRMAIPRWAPKAAAGLEREAVGMWNRLERMAPATELF